MENEENLKPNSLQMPVTVDDGSSLVAAIGAALGPLARNQAEAQIVTEQERTKREQMRLATFEKTTVLRHKKEMENGRINAVMISVILAGAFIAAFSFGQWAILTHFGTAVLGAIGGYGYAHRQFQTQIPAPHQTNNSGNLEGS